MESLVSVITPCYNGETFVHRYMESILAQTYSNIELIFVNDGSTDRTEEIVLSYSCALKEKGVQFIYIYQENAGQAAALNKGLAIFTGKYLTWPDSDDILHPENLKKKVKFLDCHPLFSMVMCRSEVVDEDNISVRIGILQRKPPKGKDNLFKDLILEKNVYFAPGGFMVKSDSFLQVCQNRTIYETRVGQNWQMLLPVAYHFKCGYIQDVLYTYLVRQNSHSHRVIEIQLTQRTFEHEAALKTVIKQMNIADSDLYLALITQKYMIKRMKLGVQLGDRGCVMNNQKELVNLRLDTLASKFYFMCSKYPLLSLCFSHSIGWGKKLRNLTRRLLW